MTSQNQFCLWGLGKIGCGIATEIIKNENDLIVIDVDDKNFLNLQKKFPNNISYEHLDISNSSVSEILKIYDK